MGKKRKTSDNNEYDPTPSHLGLVRHVKNEEKRLIIILENAQLESVKVNCSSYYDSNLRLSDHYFLAQV